MPQLCDITRERVLNKNMSILPKRRIKNPATQQEIATTNRNVAIIGGALTTLLVPGGPLAGIGKKAIGQAFKKAGSIGNIKKPDTVGNRIRQAESMLKYKTGKPVNYDKTAVPRSHVYTGGTPKGSSTFVGSYIGSHAQRKTGRTLERAVKQGPSKFFSSNRSAKTGITPGKRTLSKFDKKTNKRLREYDDVLTGMFEDGQYGSAPFDETSIERMEYEQKRFGKRKSLLKRFKK